MTEKRWLYFALGVTTVLSLGAVTNQLVPFVPPGVTLDDSGITFPDGTIQTTAAVGGPVDSRRRFYLTKLDEYDGNEADGTGVCGSGFHFASLFEILDVTSLQYDSGRGQTRLDSGLGPPSGLSGWVRTGYVSAGDPVNNNSLGDGGLRNCDAWTTFAQERDGTVAALTHCWQEGADCGIDPEYGIAQWWRAFERTCDVDSRVWCVEDYPGAAGA